MARILESSTVHHPFLHIMEICEFVFKGQLRSDVNMVLGGLCGLDESLRDDHLLGYAYVAIDSLASDDPMSSAPSRTSSRRSEAPTMFLTMSGYDAARLCRS
jgi:hypothetical protein